MDDIILEILELIRNKNLKKEELRKSLSQYHESDIADAVEQLNLKEKKEFFSKLTVEELGDLLIYLESPETYIESVDVSRAADIIETMDADDAVDVLEDVDEDFAQDIISNMEKEQREDVELIQKFDEDEVGSKITTNFIVIHRNNTIKEAMKILVKEAPINDNIQNLFVLDENEKYYGTIKLKDLIIAREGIDILDITKTNYPTLYSHDKVDDVLNEIKDIDLDIIPVLSETDDTILGVITSQDIIETVGDELSEDFVKFAAVSEDADVDDNLVESAKRRVPWLSLLLLLNIFTSSILSSFSSVYVLFPFLVLFQSWILNSAGNAGTQSLALTIRSLSDNKINKKTMFKFFIKELMTGLIDGLFVGIVGFLVSIIFLMISKNTDVVEMGRNTKILTSLIVGLSLFIATPISTLCGLFIPVFFKKIHIDPAVASGPLITTISDMCGVAIYYGVSLILFSMFNLL